MLNALSQATLSKAGLGRTRESMYAFEGDIKDEAREPSRDVHCFKASLSEQDLESVAGQSGRAKDTLAALGTKESPKAVERSYRAFSAQYLAPRNVIVLSAPCRVYSPMTKNLSARA